MTSYLETVLQGKEIRVPGRRPSAPWELHLKTEMMGEVESGERRAGAESRTGGHLLCPEDSKKASGAGQSGESKGRDGRRDRQAACRQPSDGLHGRDRAPGSVRVQDGQSDVSLWKFPSECSTENKLCGGGGRGGSYPGGNGDLMKTGWGRRQA